MSAMKSVNMFLVFLSAGLTEKLDVNSIRFNESKRTIERRRMDQSQQSEQNLKLLARCLRCSRTSYIDLIAQCEHCGSYAIKMITDDERKNRKDSFLSKEEQLLMWCRQKKIFSKAEVITYGTDAYYLRADRTIRDFVQQGIARKLGKAECIQRNLKGKMAWYEFVKV